MDEIPQSACAWNCPGCWKFAHDRQGCTMTVVTEGFKMVMVRCQTHQVSWSGLALNRRDRRVS